jgi:inosine-uridine nucleoside N-ribohydrolase
LAHPDCNLLGITTCSGDTVERARMASAMCRVAGQAVPILPGPPLAILDRARTHAVSQAAALDKWPHEDAFPQGRAVRFMQETIRRNPGRVTLLAIGPMTNVGLLFAADPEIPALLKRLVLMCGVFTTRTPDCGRVEYNAICDPHATAIVYAHACPVHRSIGLDVTKRVVLPAEEVRERFRAPILRPVRDFAEVWFRHTRHLTFHDPLAAATIFDEGLCSYERGTVDVELHSAQAAGMTHWRSSENGPHEIATGVDRDAYFDHFFEVIDRASVAG